MDTKSIFGAVLFWGSIIGIFITSMVPIGEGKKLEPADFRLKVVIPTLILIVLTMVGASLLNYDDNFFIFPTVILAGGSILYSAMIISLSYSSILWRSN
jgi:peptidoglycan biosynthesis protein MviN/MurJ (putative lipid II flippase)